MPPAMLKSWIDDQQASGRYFFERSAAIHGSGLTPHAVTYALRQSVREGRIVQLKEYAYVIVPLEYRAAGAPPASWFIHDLMASMKLPYYVGLLSAAALHGASQQQPQVFQVLTDRTVRPIPVGRTKIQFFASKYVTLASVQEMKTPTGMMRVSTPETTVVDLMRFVKVAGHIDHVAVLIKELAPLLDPKRLITAVRTVDDIPNAQRLGYILDRFRQRSLSDMLHAWIGPRIQRAQLLRSGRSAEGATQNRRWKLLINSQLETSE
jgi:predicted transcriptional regulator of viral defense system